MTGGGRIEVFALGAGLGAGLGARWASTGAAAEDGGRGGGGIDCGANWIVVGPE